MKLIKRLVIIIVIIAILATAGFAYLMVQRQNAINDVTSSSIVLNDDVTIEEIMDTLCTDVTWSNIEVTDDITYIDVDGKLKGGVPFLDGYEGAPIGFTVQVKYDENKEVESITLVDARFEDTEYDIDYDMDWILDLIYKSYQAYEMFN